MRKSMLDPKIDLKGATPETLARALLRPRQGAKPAVRNKVSKQKPAANKLRDSIPHLIQRP